MTDALRIAEGYLDANRPADAARELAGALARNPDHVRAICLAAQAALGLHDPMEALRLARHAVHVQPDGEWQYRLASVALSQLGRHREAREAALRAVALAPWLWSTHARLAFTDVKAGRVTKRTVASAGEAVRLAPDNPQAHNTAGWVELRRHPRRAAEHFRAALRIDPQNDDARNGLAAVSINRGDAAAGAKRALQQLRADPGSEPGLVLLRAAARRGAGILGVVPFLIARAAIPFLERSGVGPGAGPSPAVLVLVALNLVAVAGFLTILRARMGSAVSVFLGSIPRLEPALLAWAVLFAAGVALQFAGAFAPVPLATGLVGGGALLAFLGLVPIIVVERLRRRQRPSR